MLIAISNPVDGQPISYRAIAKDDALMEGEILFTGVVPEVSGLTGRETPHLMAKPP